MPRIHYSLLLAVFAAFLLQGCIDVVAKVTIRHDGAGELEANFAIPFALIDKYSSKYVQLDTNQLLPRTREEAQEIWGDKSGVELVSYSFEDRKLEQKTALPGVPRNMSGVRLVRMTLHFDSVDDLNSKNFRFGWFPWGDDHYFAFKVVKELEGNKLNAPYGGMGLMTAALVRDRAIKFAVDLPSRITATNGTSDGWKQVAWEIPLGSIYNFVQDEVIGWARLPAQPGHALAKVSRWWSELFDPDPFGDPKSFPSYFVLPVEEPPQKATR